MIKCKRRVIAAIIIITAAALCLTGIIFLLRVDQPVFFYTYGSYPMQTDPGSSGQECAVFNLKYVTNIEDTGTVTGIDFPEAADKKLVFTASESKQEPISDVAVSLLDNGMQNPDIIKAGRYAVHTVSVVASLTDENAVGEETVLHEAMITFSNHNTQTVSVGCIELYGSRLKADAFTWTMSTSDVNGISDSMVNVNEPITILSVGPQCIQFPDSIQYTINDVSYKDVSGMKCDKGSSLKLHSEIALSDDVIMRHNEYNICMLMHYLDEQGQEHASLIDMISHSPVHDTFRDLVNYLKVRKAL